MDETMATLPLSFSITHIESHSQTIKVQHDAHCTRNIESFLKMAISNTISHLCTISMSAAAFISPPETCLSAQ